MSAPGRKVEFFALSTCGWCRKTREWLDEHRVDYELTYMDQLEGEKKEAAQERALKFTSKLAFPLLVVNEGEDIIQGYKPERFQEALG